MEEDYLDDRCGFSGSITENGETIAFTVSKEEITKYRDKYPVTRYLVRCRHPQREPFAFFLALDDTYEWVSEYGPKFLSAKFIQRLGKLIEHHTAW